MKGTNNLFSITISLLAGALISYFLSQWKFLQIDPNVNVVDTIIAAISIVIGIFIAVFIHKRNNQNQNLYNYLITRLDAIWSDFNSFFMQIEHSDTVELAKVSAFMKNFQMKNAALVKLLKPISVPNNLEAISEELKLLLENSLVRNNIVYYDGVKSEVTDCGARMQSAFIEIYQSINSKS